jgi:UV DNA damage endonuclease
MKVTLGYACISKTLDRITTSTPFTYSEYLKANDLNKLDRVIESNLKDLIEILKYNIKNNIHFFRVSSKLIPLSTKEDVIFNYYNKYQKYYNIISKMIIENNLRIDFHPDEFCVLNSTKKEVVSSSIRILKYHYNLLKYFKINNKLLILHIGSNAFGKDNSIKRFINNFNKLPNYLKKVIAIENDDKVFNIIDCIKISKEIGCPIIFDYHHYTCNNNGEKLEDFFTDVLKSWHNKTPKIHFSSPKSKLKKEFRSHNDYINSDTFINFLNKISNYTDNIDIMIEAKKTDEAMFKLIRELKYKTNYIFIDETTFII